MSETPATEPKTWRRSHSFGGCQPCRERHLKCDLVTPVCLACRASGLRCHRKPCGLRWISGSGSGRSGSDRGGHLPAGTRQPLYTEQSQKSMSNSIEAEFTTHTVDDCLLRLDVTARGIHHTSDGNFYIGPFGVLAFQSTPANPTPPGASSIESEYQTLTNNESDGQLFSNQNLMCGFDEYLNWSDLFGFYDTTSVYGFLNSPSDGLPVNTDQTRIFFGTEIYPPQVPSIRHNGNGSSLHGSAPYTRPTFLLNLPTDDVQMLMKDFRDKTLPHMSSFPLKHKSPFHTINLAAAIYTLASITYMQSQPVSHAAFCNLLALLSLSSRSLATRTFNQPEVAARWRSVSDEMNKQARVHLRWSLETELQGLHKAKYKDQLMAIIALFGYACAYDLQDDARSYLLNSERLLRIRGLAKRKVSRRCQLMHHYYVCMRIVGETTYVLHGKDSFRANQEQVSEVTAPPQNPEQDVNEHTWVPQGQNLRLDDFLGLEYSSKEPERLETSHENVHDDTELDPNDPRGWSESRFLQLHGISQTWLSFVSQTTRLANLIDRLGATADHEKDPQLNEILERRKDRLENAICSFVASTNGSYDADVDRSFLSPHENMVRALNPALVIFFNRRIRHVNSWVLQEHVNAVMRILRDFEASLLVHNLEGPGSPWPVFIAGCEAMSKTQRDFFMGWMQLALDKTGFTRFQAMKDTMQEVWRRRDEQVGGDAWTWMRVSRERSLYIMLT